MPSIRIKGNVYASLEDYYAENDGPGSGDPQPSGGPTLSTPNGKSFTPGDNPRTHSRNSLPLLKPSDTANSDQPSPTRLRPRALTSSSRVHDHCVSRSAQYNDVVPNFHSATPSLTSPTRIYAGENMTIENLYATPGGETGLIEHSINLSRVDLNGVEDHHHDDVVEHLDVIDSQIGAISNLTNAANSIVIPPLSLYSRKPIVMLPSTPRRANKNSIEEFSDPLDRHVNDVLNSPSKIRRTLMGIWSFLKTPMGIITGIYGFLVVFWGAAIVIFLAKIINLHNPNLQGFWIEVSAQVETGLFTATSVGLIPSRILDTFRIWKIWRYKRKTMKLRQRAGLPQLFDVDDLPDPIYDPNYVHVLTETEQKDLHRQQRKFQYSQTWYRAHGTETHRAFPINMALLICFLNVGNSVFQVFLCGTMWGMNRFERPPWTTAVLIPGSFLCGIGAAIVIWRGGERTKRVDEVREKLRAALSEKPILDGQLPASLSRISQGPQDVEKTRLQDAEQPQDLTTDPALRIDEQMTIPTKEDVENMC